MVSLFFTIFPIVSYSIHGDSMLPLYKEGNKVFAVKIWLPFIVFKENDVVIARDPRDQKLLLKRITKIRDGKYFLQGDNEKASTDSRVFGWVEKKNIVGKVLSI